jgi:hypothetical protein
MRSNASEMGPLEIARISKQGRRLVGGVQGLYLAVSRTGSKSWVLRIRLDGRQKDLGLGGYPAVTVEAARRAAVHLKAELAAGKEPLMAAKAARGLADRSVKNRPLPRVDAPTFFDRSATDRQPPRISSIENPSNPLDRALREAVERLLRPLCRLLLRNEVSFNAFERLAKRAYVAVAYVELGAGKKPPTASQIAAVSGLTRKNVGQVLSDFGGAADDRALDSSRAGKVLAGWRQDADFCDSHGRPLALDSEAGPTFAELVRRYSGDMPSRAVLDELMRVKAVERLNDGSVRPVAKQAISDRPRDHDMGAFGRDVAALIETIDHNIQEGATNPRFQRKVMYLAFPRCALARFRTLCAQEVNPLLTKLDRWVKKEVVSGARSGPRHVDAGLGLYYFEAPDRPCTPWEADSER